MDKIEFERLHEEGKVFTIGKSFALAAQIPDDSQGCSASRCSNCNGVVAYCHNICEHCGLPFVGPFGIPNILEWQTLSTADKRTWVEEVFSSPNHGRLGIVNAPCVPLNPREAVLLRDLKPDERRLYMLAHKVEPHHKFFCPF